MKKLLIGLGFAVGLAIAAAAWAQSYYTIYGPVAGIQKNTGATPFNTAAVSSDIAGLWVGTGCGTTTNVPQLNGNCVSPGVSTSANPSATIGLTTVNGAATTYMTSDSAPALSQAISPTWTGTHLFNGLITSSTGTSGVTEGRNGTQVGVFWINSIGAGNSKVWDFSATATDLQARTIDDAFSSAHQWLDITRSGITQTSIVLGNSTDKAPITLNGATTIPAPTSGVAFTATGLANSYTAQVNGSSTTSQSFGAKIVAGTNASDTALLVQNQAATHNYAFVAGDGSFGLGFNGTASIVSGNAAGNVTISTPSSGTAAVINGITNGRLTDFNDGTETISVQTDASHNGLIGTIGAHSFDFFTNNTVRETINSTGNVTVSAPSSGAALTVNGAANLFTQIVQGNSTSGQSKGLEVLSGTTSADFALVVSNQANTLNELLVYGDGSVVVGNNPSGGPKGLGTINSVSTIFQNGTPVATVTSGTVTVTLTGVTATVTGTAKWSLTGNIASITLPTLTGTSNANTLSITGLPASITVTTNKTVAVPVQVVEDNGTVQTNVNAQITNGSVIAFTLNNSTTGFTASGAKGVTGVTGLTWGLE